MSTESPRAAGAELTPGTWTPMSAVKAEPASRADWKPATVQPLGDGTALIIGGADGDGEGDWQPLNLISRLDLATGESRELPHDIEGSGAMFLSGAGVTTSGVLALISRCEPSGEQGACDNASRSLHLVSLENEKWTEVELPSGIADAVRNGQGVWGPELFIVSGTPVIGFGAGSQDAAEWSFFVGDDTATPRWSVVEAPSGLSLAAMNFGPQVCANNDTVAALLVLETRDPQTASVQMGGLRPAAEVAVATLDVGKGTWTSTAPLTVATGLGHGYVTCSADTVYTALNTVPTSYFAARSGAAALTPVSAPPEVISQSYGSRIVADLGSPMLIALESGGQQLAVLMSRDASWSTLPPLGNDGLSPGGGSVGPYAPGIVLDGSSLIDVRRILEDPRTGVAYGTRVSN